MNESPWNKGKKLPVEVLTSEEVQLLLKQCSRRAPTGIRNRAMIVIMWRCMLRVSEVLALKTADFDGETIRVLHGKGDKCRVVGIDVEAASMIDLWMQTRKTLGHNGNKRLFCTLDGGDLKSVYVRNLLRRLGKKAGIEKRVHPHGLRHTGASELLSEGINVGIIQRQLGHSSIATTSRYLDHINPKEVVDVMRQREWK